MSAPTIGTQVLLKNVGEERYTGTWNSVKYVVEPGDQLHVPFELVKKDFGDPRSVEDVKTVKDHPGALPQFLPDRHSEARRLYQTWLPSEFGTRQIGFKEFIPGDRTVFATGISDRIPRVEVYDLVGNRIWTVADDPYGDKAVGPTPIASDREALEHLTRHQNEVISAQREEMEQMKRDVAMLMKRLGEGGPGGLSGPVDLGPDLPLGKSPAFQDPSPVPPVGSTATELPQMQINPQTGRVSRKRGAIPNPESVEDLPSDLS